MVLYVKSTRSLIGDKVLGALKIHTSDIIRDAGIKVVKDKYRLRNESFELDTDIATLLSFNYQWDTPENKKPELDAQSNEITMSRADFDGVLKMKLLSGTNLCKVDKFKYIYIDVTHDNNKKQTDKKTSKSSQFNQTFYFDINKDKKTFLFELINHTDTKFLAAHQTIDLDQYLLIRHKPIINNISIFGVNSNLIANLSAEFTFYFNNFTQCPLGELSVEALTLPKVEDKEKDKVYFKYIYENEKEHIEETKFHNIGKIYKFQTKSRLDRIIMVCFELPMGTFREIARGTIQICEYLWTKKQKTDVETNARSVLNLISSKDNKIYPVNLGLKFRPATARTETRAATTLQTEPDLKKEKLKDESINSVHEEESKKADSNRKVEEEVETESSAKLDRLRTTKKGKTIFGGDAQRYPAKSYLFEIETIEVKTFLLKMALIENPIYYFSIKTSHSDEVVFSSYVDSQLLEWHDENLLVRIPENCSVIVLTLHEKTFCTWNNETKKLVPIDIISFSMEIPKMVKEGLHKYVEYVADASISDEFRSFVRKNKIINEDSYVKDPIAALEKTKIKIQYELNGTFFIDNPCGIFNVTAIKGEGIHKIAIDGSKKKIKTSIQMSIENQNIIFDGEVDEQNPIWTKNASLITFNAQDVIMIRIFETDVDKTNPIIDAFINLHLIQIFEDGEQLSHTIDLSKSNTYMKGMLTFDFTYTAVKQNSSKKIKEIDLKDPKQKSALDMFYEKTFSMEKPKIPELPDWLSVYSNKINKVQIDLDEIELDLKQLKGPYIVQNIFKLGDQIFVGKQFYNVSEIRYNEKIEFLSSPAKENERNINILIKVVDFYNPNRILRVYTYYFDYLKHIQSDKTFIEINKKLIASSLYSPDPDDTSNITFRYKYFEPLFKNLPSKIGMIFIRPSQIRLSGTYNHEKPIWHPMTGYFLEMAFNGVKQVIKLKPGKPKTESLIQILNETVYRYSEKQFDGTDFFIDAKDLNQDSILDVSIDRTVICFPLRKINDNFIKVKLYQIDTEGLSSGQFNPRMNPFSKLIARGKIDIDHLKELPKVSWAVNLHKEANLIMHENISDIIHTNLMQIFLTFNMDYKMTDLFEPVKFKPNLKSKGHKVDEQAESILTIIKEMKFNFVNHEKPLLFAKAIQFKEKQARSGGNSELNCPLRSLVTNKINALRAAGVSYNPLTSLFDHRIYMEERIKKTTQLSVISLDFKPETEVGDIKKLDPAAFLNMKPSLHDLNLPQDILGKKDQTVIYHTEIKSDGNYSGECIMHFDTTSNFFVEIPIGNLNISKIEINGRDGAVIENDLVFEFYLKNKVEEAPSSIFKYPLPEFSKDKDKYVNTKAMTFQTNFKTACLVVQIKTEKNPGIIAKSKAYLYQFEFPNPHILDNYKDDELRIQKILLIPFPNKASPLAFIAMTLHCLYKDCSTLGQYAINNFYTVMKFRKALNKKLDTLRNIVYLNPSAPPFIFSGKFRRVFYGGFPIDSNALPIIKLNEKDYINRFTDTEAANYSKKALCLTFLEYTKIFLGGVPDSKQPMKLQAFYIPIEKDKKADPNSASLDAPPNMYEKVFRPEEYKLRFYVENERNMCEMEILTPLYFFFQASDIKEQTLYVTISYQDRILGPIQQKAALKYENYFSNKVNSPPTKLFLFFKPSNTKTLVELSQISSEFINEPRGRLTLEFHRIVSIESDEFDKGPLEYRNKTLSLKKEEKGGGKTFQKLFKYRLKIADDDQEFSTNIINSKGFPDDGMVYKMEFLTNGLDQSLDIKLILNKESAHINNQALSELLVDKRGAKIIEGEENILKEKDVVLVVGKLPLAFYSLHHTKNYPLMLPLSKYNHPQNDLYQVLLNTFNRENYYLLASINYKPEMWFKIEMNITKIQNLIFAKLEAPEGVELPTYTQIGIRIEINRRIDTSTTKKISTYESNIYELPLDKDTLELPPSENFNFVYENILAEGEELFAMILVEKIEGETKTKIAGKSILMRQFVINAAKNKDPTLLITKLPKSEESTLLDPKVKELPIELCVNIKRNLLEFKPPEEKIEIKPNIYEFDYSKQTLDDLIMSLLNCRETVSSINCIKEIDEYFMFLHQNAEETKLSKIIFECFYVLISINHTDISNLTQGIKSMFSFLNFKPEIVSESYFSTYLDLLWEITTMYSKHYLLKLPENVLKKDNNIIQDIFDTKIEQESQKITKEELEFMKREDIQQVLIKNLLKKKEVAKIDSVDLKEFTKLFSYILKTSELIISEKNDYCNEICLKLLPILTALSETYIISDENSAVLITFLKFIRRILIDNSEITSSNFTLAINQNLIMALIKCEFKKNVEIPDVFHTVLEFSMKKLLTITNDESILKLTFERIAKFYLKNFVDNMVFNYYFFGILETISTSPLLAGPFLQEIIRISDLYFKLSNYLLLIAKSEDKSVDKEAIQLASLLYDVFPSYEIKNLNKERISANIQLVIVKRGLNERARILLTQVVNNFKDSKESQNKLKPIQQAAQKNKTSKASKDITTKYLISKLDWK